jgi:hypothetical protein
MIEEKWNYTCPRCSYETHRKDTMEKHLNRRRLCPGGQSNIEITEEIKQIILKERIYHIPKASKHVSNVVNYNYNNVMTLMNTSLTPIEMVKSFNKYNKINVIGVDDYFEDKFCEISSSLENPDFCLELKIDDLLSVIEEITSSKKLVEELNILYDSKLDQINLKEDSEWKPSIVNLGLKIILSKLQDYYLDYYECSVITKIVNSNNELSKQQNRELLDEYYRFIAAFDLPPFVKGRKDEYIVRSILDENATSVSDQFMSRYNSVKGKLKLTDRRSIQKGVLDILKRNSAMSINSIKSRISDMFCNDKLFQEFMKETIKKQNMLLS